MTIDYNGNAWVSRGDLMVVICSECVGVLEDLRTAF